MLSIYRAGEIDLFENLDIVHIRLLVASRPRPLTRAPGAVTRVVTRVVMKVVTRVVTKVVTKVVTRVVT